MGERPLALDDISELWPAPRTDLVPPILLDLDEPGLAHDSRPSRRAVPGSLRAERLEAEGRLERKAARLDHRLEALVREVVALAESMTAQADRLSALEKRIQESMLLVADTIERPTR